MPKRQKDGGAHATSHTPVLLEEVIAGLALQPGATVIDATLGNGGHFFAIAERLGPKGTLLGVDVDVAAVESVRATADSLGVEVEVIAETEPRVRLDCGLALRAIQILVTNALTFSP